jgi:hypothetical protein
MPYTGCDIALAPNGTSSAAPSYGLPDPDDTKCNYGCRLTSSSDRSTTEACGSNSGDANAQRLSLYQYVVSESHNNACVFKLKLLYFLFVCCGGLARLDDTRTSSNRGRDGGETGMGGVQEDRIGCFMGQRRHDGSNSLGLAGMWRNFARRKGGVAGAFTEHTCLDIWRSMHVPTQTLHSCESQIEMPVLSTSFSTHITINTHFSSHVTTRTFPFMTYVKGSAMFRACKFANTS